jgi:hypothetical protein
MVLVNDGRISQTLMPKLRYDFGFYVKSSILCEQTPIFEIHARPSLTLYPTR